MSSINNPNTLALILLIGMLSFVIDINVEKLSSFITTMFANVMMLYGIILTGSRKCFLAAIPVMVYWIWFYIKVTRKEGRTKRMLFLMVVMALGLGVCFSFYSKYFQSTSIFERLLGLFSEGGTTIYDLKKVLTGYTTSDGIVAIQDEPIVYDIPKELLDVVNSHYDGKDLLAAIGGMLHQKYPDQEYRKQRCIEIYGKLI